ncbi:E3 ubiquitin-protein ligase TRIM39 [Larimichthys crocea]|uniref:Uncharacterized protein n=1 Tax=Larimichthys crocea TaxID=215358 RepID=A0ACD3Q5L3_LARCR|nr:E3 ubiquitin-protein ligase TRIM39 [Larimichthys crocea]
MTTLGKKRSELKHLIKERAKKLDEIKQSIKVIKASSQKELEESWQVYAELQRMVEQSQAELVEVIATRQREAERHAQELARGLENELSQLRRRSNELEAYAQTKDKVVFLQNLATLPPPPEPADWSAVSINTDLYLGTIRSSVSGLIDKFQEELKRLYGKELRKVQNYSSEVILDPNTAQRNLVVSEDGRQVRYEERKTSHSEGPKRFNPALFILGREGLTSGRHYWEVDTGRKTAWTLGMASSSARRKGEIKLSPEGGYWCLWLKSGERPQYRSRFDATFRARLLALKMTLPLRRVGMATTGNLSEEQVHCSICLDVFTNPVSIPCGHNFCQSCILGYWKTSPLYQCPMCKKSFYKRPDLSINTVLREIAQQFKEIRVRSVEGKVSEEEEEEEEEEEDETEKKWTMERRKKEDEERLLVKDQKQQLMEELMQKQEEDRRKKEKAGEKRPQQEELPPLIPPKTSPPPSPQAKAEGPPPLPQTSPLPSPQILPSPSPQSSPSTPSPSVLPSSWEEVLCDVCLGEGRPKAVKSCLVCLTSYCEEHLRSHSARFTKHKLMEPVANMEDRMCPKHERLLELFCKKDQTCVCVLCTETDHRSHYTVPVEREWMEKKAQLKRTEIDVQQMMQDRVKKVEDIKHCVELNKASAQREIEETVQVFSELVRSIQRTQAELVVSIEEKQRQTERWAEGFIAELEQEIEELKRRNADLENVARADHIHFLKNFPALSTPPSVKDWSETSVPTDTCIGMIRRSVSKLETTLNDLIGKLADSEIKKILKYAADVTLDADSANPWLQLSQDRRQVRHLGAWQDLPDNPDRFDTVVIVLGRDGFTSGRHYWEVQVGDKDDWYMGVAKSSVNRKGRISVSTTQGYWALAMKKGQGYRVSTKSIMSSSSVFALLPEDNFQCSICLNVFNDPVTTPCGHNFCKTCLSEHWDKSDLCHCPECNKRFHVRPEISTNMVIEEISVQLKKRRVETPELVDAPWQENIESKKAKIDMMIEVRMEKMKEFRDSSEMSSEKAQQEIEDSEKLFTSLMNQVREAQTKLKCNIEEKLRKSRDKDEAVIGELQEEIAELQRKQSELEELSQSDDHLHLLQTLQALSTMSVTKNWSKIRVYSDLYVQTLRRAMTHLVHAFQAGLKTLTDAELTRMRRYKESVTFDPAAAGRDLVVTEHGTCLKYVKTESTTLSDYSKLANDRPMILGTKGFTSGRHYWEVKVGLRTDWDVGVAKGTVTRSRLITLNQENGFFAIGKRGSDYKVHCADYKVLHLCPRPNNVGVYLDYQEGRVSFFDVDRKLHIYSFTGESFTEKLFPYFYLYSWAKKSKPLHITFLY